MKLIGSMLEDSIRKTVETSQIDAKNFEGDPRILEVLQDHVQNFRYAYQVSHTPEQGADIFIFLADLENIVTIEVSRVDPEEEAIVETMTVKEFMSGPKRKAKILTMQMALEMLERDLKELEK